MFPKQYQVKLKRHERSRLQRMLRAGEHPARVQTRARILLRVDAGRSDKAVSEELGVALTTPRDTRKRYATGRLERALFDAARSGQPPVLDGKQKAKIIALACTSPPDGHGRWTLSLLEGYVRRRVKAVGRTTVYRVLLGSELKPWREKNVVHSGA